VAHLFHKARILYGSHPVDVFNVLHPPAKIEAPGVLINVRLLQADEGLNLVTELDFPGTARIVTIIEALHSQADLPGDGIYVRE
jgi:hypothetical protein